MKLRKTLVAAATALTVATAGTAVASAQEAAVTAEVAVNTNDDQDDGQEQTSSLNTSSQNLSSQLLGSSVQESDPEDVIAWIGVFTAIIGALGTFFTFTQNFR